jgi:hypothetical protein
LFMEFKEPYVVVDGPEIQASFTDQIQ